MINVRLAIGCAAFILMSGCSGFFKPSGQYVSLPRTKVPGTLLSLKTTQDHVQRRVTVASFRQDGPTIDPVAVLGRSRTARLGWEDLRRPEPADPARRGVMRSFADELTDPKRLLQDPDYNREARMRSLLEDGFRAARPICVGC
ncbi:hypothetical protein [Methylobacterium planeticum]|uniref:Uncharacterized protein n=1 Tax=Methylobacterium planeticum TaxID=2615211 RepID=A0A6N6MHP5_9HYPH|nr:hypothetical protein [Methylobacterium planeticum]KAB1068490.1 hypothetical protein F6X51_26900 [Methylobacterium planeticum]